MTVLWESPPAPSSVWFGYPDIGNGERPYRNVDESSQERRRIMRPLSRRDYVDGDIRASGSGSGRPPFHDCAVRQQSGCGEPAQLRRSNVACGNIGIRSGWRRQNGLWVALKPSNRRAGFFHT
jgi:hypothetical protein